MEKYTLMKIEIEKLKKPHLIYERLEMEYWEQDAIDAEYFDFYENPVITKDNIPLSHVEAIESAKVNGLKTIWVIKANDLQESDIIRFIASHVRVKRLKPSQRYEFIVLLRDHLENNAQGAEWANQIKGNINQKIGKIIGYDDKTVQEWQRVGKIALKCLEQGVPPGELDRRDDENRKKRIKEPDVLIDELRLSDFKFDLDAQLINYKGRALELNFDEKRDSNSVSYQFKDNERRGSITITITNPSSFTSK